MQIDTISSVMGLLNVPDLIGNTGTMIATGVLLVLSLLVCFLGLRGIRVLMALYGFIIGFVAGFAIAGFMDMSMVISAVIGVIVGILLAIISYNLYIALWFIGVWIIVAGALIGILPVLGLEGIPVYVIGVIAGLLIGIVILKIAEIIILLVTSIGGGFGAAACVGMLFPVNTDKIVLILGAVLSLIGLILQLRFYLKNRKMKAQQKKNVKEEMKKSKAAEVEEAMNVLDLDDDDDFEVMDTDDE